MRIKYLGLILVLLIRHTSCLAEVDVCNPEKANAYLDERKYKFAFEFLKNCENSSKETAEILSQLAFLHRKSFGLGDFKTDRERVKKAYELYLKAALKGNELSISIIKGVFEHGDQMLDLKKEPEKALCLEKLLSQDDYTFEEIKCCIE